MSTNSLDIFEPYKDDYDELGGNGFFDNAEVYSKDELDEEMLSETFQYYDLHLNYKKSDDKWSVGYYLFFKTTDGVAFELFMLNNSDFTTCAKIHIKYTSKTLEQIAVQRSPELITKVLDYFPALNVVN